MTGSSAPIATNHAGRPGGYNEAVGVVFDGRNHNNAVVYSIEDAAEIDHMIAVQLRNRVWSIYHRLGRQDAMAQLRTRKSCRLAVCAAEASSLLRGKWKWEMEKHGGLTENGAGA